MDLDSWQEVFAIMRRHKLRTLLTGFGVFWGVFMFVAMLGASGAMRQSALVYFEGYENAVFLMPGPKTSIPYRGLSPGRQITLNDEDVAAIRDQVEGIDLITPQNFLDRQQVVRNAISNNTFYIDGIYPETQIVQNLQAYQGRFINQLDLLEKRKVAVIGTLVRDTFFPGGENPIGGHIEILGIQFQVIGVVGDYREGTFEEQDANIISIPNSTLRYAYNQTEVISRLFMTPVRGVKAATIEADVRELLQQRHKIHPDDKTAIYTHNIEERYDERVSFYEGIENFSWLVAFVTILIGALGVSNIMIISVNERSREIAVRKSLGARPAAIVRMITHEAMVITALSGIAGLAAGILAVDDIARFMSSMSNQTGYFVAPQISLTAILGALALLLFAGLLAAIYPAYKAAKLHPATVLQHE